MVGTGIAEGVPPYEVRAYDATHGAHGVEDPKPCVHRWAMHECRHPAGSSMQINAPVYETATLSCNNAPDIVSAVPCFSFNPWFRQEVKQLPAGAGCNASECGGASNAQHGKASTPS